MSDDFTDADKAHCLRKLKEDPGFLYLNALIQQQVDAMQREILFGICETPDKMIKSEILKAELRGKLSWMDLLETTLENLEVNAKHKEETNAT